MSDHELPPACSPTDQILVAIHDRLGELLDRLPARPEPERADGTVELREPKPPASPGGEKREPAGGRGSPRPAPRRKPTPKKST